MEGCGGGGEESTAQFLVSGVARKAAVAGAAPDNGLGSSSVRCTFSLVS
jgi:hypothetical protein